MSDFDTRRIGEIAVLEEQLQNAQQQAAGYRLIAERWQPRFASSIDGDVAKISMTFGGKTMTATYKTENLANVDETSATTEVLETLCSALVIDQLRPIVMGDIRKMIQTSKQLKKVGEW